MAMQSVLTSLVLYVTIGGGRVGSVSIALLVNLMRRMEGTCWAALPSFHIGIT